MSNLLDLPSSLSHVDQIRRGRVLAVTEGAGVMVQLVDTLQAVDCQVLHPGMTGLRLTEGDSVLLWLQDAAGKAGVVLGRIGPYAEAACPVVAADEFAARPQTLVVEAQGDLVLRNGQSKIKLGAKGDVEIVCSSFTTRSQRLLRLLAPLIKLN